MKCGFLSVFILCVLISNSFAEKFKVISVFPENNAKNVEYNTNIMIEFNHPVDKRTLTPYNIFVNSKPVSELYPEITRIPMLDYYKFVLPIPIEYGMKYTIQLSSCIKDDYGNSLAPFEFSFTTVNKEKLKVVSSKYSILTDEEGNKILSLEIKFNREVDIRLRDIKVYYKNVEHSSWKCPSLNNISDTILITVPIQTKDGTSFDVKHYKIEISTTVCDIFGEHLKTPFVWKGIK